MCLRGQHVVAGGGQRLFRYADFVTCLGGSEYELGWIVGVGMLGSIAMRIFQGVGIDRYVRVASGWGRWFWCWSACCRTC